MGRGGEELLIFVLNDTSEEGRNREMHADTDVLRTHTHTNPTQTQESLNCLTLIRNPTWDIPLQLPHRWEEPGVGNKHRSSNIWVI